MYITKIIFKYNKQEFALSLSLSSFLQSHFFHGTSNGVLRFMLSSTMNILTTPDNLRRWGSTRVAGSCFLCHGQATLLMMHCTLLGMHR